MDNMIIEGNNELVHVVKHKDVEFRLRGVGWNKTIFAFLKANAKGHAKVVLFEKDGKDVRVPIADLEWVK